MLTGIIIGAIMVVIVAVTAEIRITVEKNKNKKLKDRIEFRDNIVDKMQEDLKEITNKYFELIDTSRMLLDDYTILADLFIDEVGVQEADERFIQKKKELEPKDLNSLLNKLKDDNENDDAE